MIFSSEARPAILQFYNYLHSQSLRCLSYLCLYILVLSYAGFILLSLFRFIKNDPLPDKCETPFSLEATFLLAAWDWLLRRDVSASWYQAYIRDVLFTLLFCAACSILEKILSARGFKSAMDRCVLATLKKIEQLQQNYEIIGSVLRKHKLLTYFGSLLLLLLSRIIFFLSYEPEAMIGSAAVLVVAYCLYLAYAIHSCRCLLILFMGFSWVYALQLESIISSTLWPVEHSQGSEPVIPLVFMCYTLLWCFSALIADDDSVQMALKIVNTMTTLAAIIGNICIPLLAVQSEWFGTFFDGFDNETILMIGFNLFILPLVAAGYLAALMKDAQIYLRKKNLSVSMHQSSK